MCDCIAIVVLLSVVSSFRMFFNTITSESLEIPSRNFQDIILWRKRWTSSKIAIGVRAWWFHVSGVLVTPFPIHRGTRYCFRSISFFVSFFLCFFVSKFTRKRLDRYAWNFPGRWGVTMGRRDSILSQFRETARCRDAQHGDGVCCALAPQLV